MSIPDSILGSWSHHHSGTASKQAHVSIRNVLANYRGLNSENDYDIFLQGSYKNDTNLRRDSDVDLVVQLVVRVQPRLTTLSSSQLEQEQSHKLAHEKWKAFRRQVLNALRATYGTEAVTPGRKSLKLSKGKIPASADVVVTLHCGIGLAFYLPDEHRWVVSYPQQHHTKGLRKERGTTGRYKRAIRMFKATRNHLIENDAIAGGTAPSYFIECLLYNVPNILFKPSLAESYDGIIDYLTVASLQQFECQNGVQELFGPSKDLWNVDDARKFIKALGRFWDKWPEFA